MAKWEYRKLDLNDLPRGSDDVGVLNRAGGEGWELVSITRNNVAYLKRAYGDPAKAVRRKPVGTILDSD
jgi:hypothetical protein